MKLLNAPNINYVWSTLLIEELIRHGVTYFCVSPGSRSSPLTLAVADNRKAKSFIHFDERGTAYHALGYASATRKPCVLISTSGTAAANFFPAIIEASKKKIPLIVLTADRPPELRFTGAHQTIDQVKMYGEYVRWHFDCPCPSKDIAPEFLLTTAGQAMARSQGELPGPVHINCMFREPLAPIRTKEKFIQYLSAINPWLNGRNVYTEYSLKEESISPKKSAQILKKLKKIKSGIIVIGKLASMEERRGVIKLAEKLGWPIFPDVSSGLRLGSPHPQIVQYFDHILLSKKLLKKYRCDGVLHLGGRITSKRWYQYVENARPKEYVMVLNHPLRNDPLHNVTLRVQNSISLFCETVSARLKQKKPNDFLKVLQRANKAIDETFNKIFQVQKKVTEPQAARLITQNLPKDSVLFLANSLPIREVDMYAAIDGHAPIVGGNRGTSGIDGTIASAVGYSLAAKKATTLLIGDLAFLYDLNSLSMLRDLKKPMVVVVLNNNGGGIFSLLPVAKTSKHFEQYFGTPHNMQFKGASELFGLQYVRPKTKHDFVQEYKAAFKRTKSTIIEITTDRKENIEVMQSLQRKTALMVDRTV